MKVGVISRQAQYLNYKEDGIKLRAVSFKNKKAYTRTKKHRNKDWDNG